MRFFIVIVCMLLLSGCAISGSAVREKHHLNTFAASTDYLEVASVVEDMSRYCDSGIFVVERSDMHSIERSTIDLKNKNSDHYYMSVDVSSLEKGSSLVSVYHIFNNKVTQRMSRQVEQWVNYGSVECVQGF